MLRRLPYPAPGVVRSMQAPKPAAGDAPELPATESASQDYAQQAQQFASIVRSLRQAARLTLQDLGKRAGLSVSTLSKIENNQLSPTYETLLRLAGGLQVDVSELFSAGSATTPASGRRSVTRRGHGIAHASPQYQYELLCAELSKKRFLPLLTTIRARRLSDFQGLSHHEGEEFIYVLSGTVELHTEHYAPTRLEPGDSCYFDSAMGHACLSVGDGDAQILWVSSLADTVAHLGDRGDAGNAGQADASTAASTAVKKRGRPRRS